MSYSTGLGPKIKSIKKVARLVTNDLHLSSYFRDNPVPLSQAMLLVKDMEEVYRTFRKDKMRTDSHIALLFEG